MVEARNLTLKRRYDPVTLPEMVQISVNSQTERSRSRRLHGPSVVGSVRERCGVNFSEQPPSKQWAALKYRGKQFAEVWFKPECDPLALTFRIPSESFRLAGMAQLLTLENLLKAVAIAPEEVESWRHDRASPPELGEGHPELGQPLLLPLPDVPYLTIAVSLRRPPPVDTREQGQESGHLLEKLQELESRWNAILVLEAAINALRQRVEGAETEMEVASKKMLTTEEKVNAPNADVAQWNKAKSRARYALPKVKDFVHRATWSMSTPERKELGELLKDGVRPDIPLDEVTDQLERLLKNRQVLSAQGGAAYQECLSVTTAIQGALRTLQCNAASNGLKKRNAARNKGKI